MTTVYLALGSNVGDRAANIAKSIELLGLHLQRIRQAPLYQSKPVGITNQPDFINTAISGETNLAPEDLFSFIKKVEQQVGRQARYRWGPREIDIDIVFYGDQIIKNERLTVPHARFHERDFVLKPLCDLAPELSDPLTKQTVRSLLDQLNPAHRSISELSNS